ncbi:MAG: DUF3794 domain-containing protein [Clostridia bacterium]|nr:DUF3794 domain-containing protein [Clostridia bacterium]
MNYSDSMGSDATVHVTLPILDRRMNTETTGEYTLPDYRPEIRRVLSVTPTVLPPAKYVGGAGVELNGTVDYSVLYVGADGELYSFPISSEYHFTLPIEAASEFDLGAGVCVWADVVAENVSSRVSSPRKMSLRCRLQASVRAFGKILMEERTVGEARSESLFRRREVCRNLSVGSGLSDVISLGCELSAAEDTRVISADATPIIDEVRVEGEMARVSGEVLLKLLVTRDGSTPTVLTQKLPLSGEVELEGMDGVDECCATGTVSELSVEMGEGGKILCEISVLLAVRGMNNREIVYTADLFSGERESACEYREYRVPVALRCDRRNFSQSERLSLSEFSFAEGGAICDAWGSVLFDGCEAVGGKYVLTGQSKYVLLWEKDGEYSTSEITLPFRYETDGREESPESYLAGGTLLSCRARVEGHLLCLDAEIAVAADFIGYEKISAVREVRFGEAYAIRGSRMSVYYPASDEDAWCVAKKYHIAPERINKGKKYYYF